MHLLSFPEKGPAPLATLRTRRLKRVRCLRNIYSFVAAASTCSLPKMSVVLSDDRDQIVNSAGKIHCYRFWLWRCFLWKNAGSLCFIRFVRFGTTEGEDVLQIDKRLMLLGLCLLTSVTLCNLVRAIFNITSCLVNWFSIRPKVFAVFTHLCRAIHLASLRCCHQW